MDLTSVVILLVSALFASVVAAIGGFGGAAILLPALVAVVGVQDAVPTLTIAQLIGNGSRAWFNRRDLCLPIVGWFGLGAVPLALLGGSLFVAAPVDLLQRLVGAFLVASVAWRHLRRRPPRRVPPPAFTVIGAGFGLLSAIVGTVGPLMAPFFLVAGLTKGAYIGTEALATVSMHVPKLVAYGLGGILTVSISAVGLGLGPVMVAGSYLGKRVLNRLPTAAFLAIIDAVLVVSGVTLFVTA